MKEPCYCFEIHTCRPYEKFSTKNTLGILLIEHKNPNWYCQIYAYMINVKPEKISKSHIESIIVGLEHEYIHYALLKMREYEAYEKLDNLYSILGNYKKWVDDYISKNSKPNRKLH